MSNNEKKYLSYSGYSMYCQCPKKFEYHYFDKLRPDSISSNLIFGAAVDKALNDILLGKSKEDALESAKSELKRLSTENVMVQGSDFDYELLTESSLLSLDVALKSAKWEGVNPNNLAMNLFQKISFGETLDAQQKLQLNYLVYFSFLEKITLIIDGFIDYVLPKIEEVISVQTNVKRGILDFTAKFKGIDGIVTCDNKTSSRDYDPNAVRVSVQLAGYEAIKGCYIVFNKTVRKNRIKTCSVCKNDGTGKRHKTCDATVNGVRCNGEWSESVSPEVIPQIIIDDIPEHTRNIVEQAYQDVEQLIETKIFPRNLNNCGKHFGQPCPYIGLCWENQKTGLIEIK